MAKTRNTSELRPYNFSLVCEKLPNSIWFLQEFTVPGLSIEPIPLAAPDATSRIFIPGDGIRSGEVLVLTMKLDEEMTAWFDFYDWMRKIRHEDEIKQHMLFNNHDLLSDITIVMRNNNQRKLCEFRFRHCWPAKLSEFQMKTTTEGAEIITFSAEIITSSYTVVRPSEMELPPKGEPQ